MLELCNERNCTISHLQWNVFYHFIPCKLQPKTAAFISSTTTTTAKTMATTNSIHPILKMQSRIRKFNSQLVLNFVQAYRIHLFGKLHSPCCLKTLNINSGNTINGISIYRLLNHRIKMTVDFNFEIYKAFYRDYNLIHEILVD